MRQRTGEQQRRLFQAHGRQRWHLIRIHVDHIGERHHAPTVSHKRAKVVRVDLGDRGGDVDARRAGAFLGFFGPTLALDPPTPRLVGRERQLAQDKARPDAFGFQHQGLASLLLELYQVVRDTAKSEPHQVGIIRCDPITHRGGDGRITLGGFAAPSLHRRPHTPNRRAHGRWHDRSQRRPNA